MPILLEAHKNACRDARLLQNVGIESFDVIWGYVTAFDLNDRIRFFLRACIELDDSVDPAVASFGTGPLVESLGT